MTNTTPINDSLHSRNAHRNGYDFSALSKKYPLLLPFLRKNPKNKTTIDYANPDAVKALNSALISYYYNTPIWNIPEGFLCPAIPGRADYIHYIADLLANNETLNDADSRIPPLGKNIVGLDIGTGANLVYPIIGSHTYGWRFVGAEVHDASLTSASLIIGANPRLKKLVRVRLQSNKENIFHGIITSGDHFDFTMCNPPFHASAQDAKAGSDRKIKGLTRHQEKRLNASPIKTLNFGGQSNELWCDGGERQFIHNMIKESQDYSSQVKWFTTLVSKKTNVPPIIELLKKMPIQDHRVVEMAQGNKISRFVAWRF